LDLGHHQNNDITPDFHQERRPNQPPQNVIPRDPNRSKRRPQSPSRQAQIPQAQAADRRRRRRTTRRSRPRRSSTPQDDLTPIANDHTDSPAPPTQDIARLHLSGRNYDFETKGPKLGFEAPPTLELDKATLEQQAADLEQESKRQAAIDAQDEKGIDLFKLQPKKPNWDLKRELNLKMEVLNVRTENAIARLVRERLAEKKAAAEAARGGSKKTAGQQGDGDVEAEGMLDGAALVEGMRLREREEAEENRREREAEAVEFGMA
jgi:coiled-coil domain-containing protein 12